MSKYFRYSFGELGDLVTIPDELQSSGSVSYQQGFGYDYQRKLGVDTLAKPVPRQQTNQLYNDITSALKQYQEHGFFDFITSAMNGGQPFSYSMGASVRYDISDAQDGSDVRNFSSKINNNTGNPKDNSDDWSEIGKNTDSGYTFISINQDTVLNTTQAGIILIDATAGNINVTLPSTDLNIDYILKRIDNTTNIVKIQTTGTDKIKYNMSVNANGYSFFMLFGAGDYWQVVSDGQGTWFDIDREDKTKIGKLDFIASTLAPTGGYIAANGSELSRTDYPFLWDFAQYSGLLINESDKDGKEGCFTTGDGSTTFRIPDLRGEFLRALDSERGVDLDRLAGSWQDYSTALPKTKTLKTLDSQGNTYNLSNANNPSQVSFTRVSNSGEGVTQGSRDTGGSGLELDIMNGVTGDSETRARNIAYTIYIKII